MVVRNNYSKLNITKTERLEHKKFLAEEKKKDKTTPKRVPTKAIIS